MRFFQKKVAGPVVRMHIRPPNYGVGKPPSVIATYLRFGIIESHTLIAAHTDFCLRLVRLRRYGGKEPHLANHSLGKDLCSPGRC